MKLSTATFFPTKWKGLSTSICLFLLFAATVAFGQDVNSRRSSFNDGWLFQKNDPVGAEGILNYDSIKNWISETGGEFVKSNVITSASRLAVNLGEANPFDGPATTLSTYTDAEIAVKVAADIKTTGKIAVPQRSSYFGIFDLCGFKKDRFYLYQTRWRPELPMAHILPHWDWPERLDKVTPVHVYTSGDEAELYLNGVSLDRKKRTPFQYRLRWDDVIYQPGELKAIAYKNGETRSEDVVRTALTPTQIQMEPDRAEIAADGSDRSFITVKICDKSNSVVPRTKNRLKFELTGPGEIVGIDNGDATDLEPFKTLDRRTFNGMALVVVRSKKDQSGKISVKASKASVPGQP